MHVGLVAHGQRQLERGVGGVGLAGPPQLVGPRHHVLDRRGRRGDGAAQLAQLGLLAGVAAVGGGQGPPRRHRGVGVGAERDRALEGDQRALGVAALAAQLAEAQPQRRLAGAHDLVAVVLARQGAAEHLGGGVDGAAGDLQLRREIDGVEIVRIALDGALGGGAGAHAIATGEVVARGAGRRAARSAAVAPNAAISSAVRRRRGDRRRGPGARAASRAAGRAWPRAAAPPRPRPRSRPGRALLVGEHHERHVAERLEQAHPLGRLLGRRRLAGQQIGGAAVDRLAPSRSRRAPAAPARSSA